MIPLSIVGGAIDVGDEAVVAIVERPLCSEEFTIVCTGTVVGPRTVLTAAHCVPPGAAREVRVGAKLVVVTEAIRHPSFDDATHAFDLAILKLAEPADVAPIAMPTATLDASFVGAAARIVGFGVESAGAIADGNRRSGSMQIESIDARTFVATPNPGNTCGGDSGGPVFVTVGASEQLLGITVAGDPTCVARAVDGRVDISVADFLTDAIAAPAPAPPPGPPCMKPPGMDEEGSCASSAPTSAWLVLLACTLRRRRRAASTR